MLRSTTLSLSVLITLFSFSLVPPAQAASTVAPKACATGSDLASADLSSADLSSADTWRGGFQAGEHHCFELTVDAAGLLAVDLSLAPDTLAPGRLEWLGGERGRVVRRSASTLLVAVPEAGTYRLRVASQDRTAEASFKLRSAFVAGDLETLLGTTAKGGEEEEADPYPTPKGGEEEEADPYPTAKGGEEEEADPYPAKGGEEEEADPYPVLAGSPLGSPYDLAARPRQLRDPIAWLCAQGEQDDHGDTFACASRLPAGEIASGTLANAFGDDEDVFRFRLREPRTVDLGVAGDAALHAEIYDRRGQRLAAASIDGSGTTLSRTLMPGVYFVRLTSAASDVEYAVAVHFGQDL